MLLAQSNGSSSILVWSLILFAVVFAGFFVVVWVKRKVKEPDAPASVGFSLADLRDMHRRGQLTDEEFERARGKMAQALKAAAARQEKARPPGQSPGRPPGR